MCSCKFTVGSADNLKDKFPVVLSSQGISQGRSKEIFLCLYHTSPSKFNDAFKGIVGDVKGESDVVEIANAHDGKLDVSNFKTNFMNIARNIQFSQEELSNASCTIGLSL